MASLVIEGLRCFSKLLNGGNFFHDATVIPSPCLDKVTRTQLHSEFCCGECVLNLT